MASTVLELIENLKHYPDGTKLTIKDVDDQEFAIIDFKLENNILSIVIVEKDEEPEEAEAA